MWKGPRRRAAIILARFQSGHAMPAAGSTKADEAFFSKKIPDTTTNSLTPWTNFQQIFRNFTWTFTGFSLPRTGNFRRSASKKISCDDNRLISWSRGKRPFQHYELFKGARRNHLYYYYYCFNNYSDFFIFSKKSSRRGGGGMTVKNEIISLVCIYFKYFSKKKNHIGAKYCNVRHGLNIIWISCGAQTAT